MLRSILLPIDGSEASLLAAETLADLIDKAPATQVTIAIAIEPLSTVSSDYDEDTVIVQNAKMRDRAQIALAKTATVFERRSIEHVTKIVEGDPVSAALAREVETGSYDAVAMGSRGMGMEKTDTHYIGSVTEHVIRRVNIPVIVIPVH